MFDTETVQAVERLANAHKIEPESLLAIAEVESDGKAFAYVRGRNEPLIRWEGHCFDRRLVGEKQEAARAAGLASPSAGAVKNLPRRRRAATSSTRRRRSTVRLRWRASPSGSAR